MSRTRQISIFVLATSLVGLVALEPASGVQPAKKLPRKSQPVPMSHTAPDVTATIPQRAQPQPPRVDDETLPPLFYLPAAPRARLRACGQQWDGIKMAGAAGNQTWRDFATQCLVQPDQPAKPKANR